MKEMIRFLAILVVAFTTSVAFAQETTGTYDSRVVARSALLRPPSHYTFSVNIQTSGTYYSMEGMMNLNKEITYLTVNEQDISIDEPLKAIPWPTKDKVNYFYIYLAGVNSNTFVSEGWFYSFNLAKGSPVNIVMKPTEVGVIVDFTQPAGTHLTLVTPDGGKVSWNPTLGGFVTYVDPTKITEYTIFDESTGIVYEKGTIDPYGDIISTQGESMVNMSWVGNVRELRFTKPEYDYIGLNNQVMDGNTVVSGTTVPAKVYMISTLGGKYLGFQVLGVEGKVIVQQATSSGEMPVITTGTSTSPWNIPWIDIVVPPGYDNLIITVIGIVQGSPKGFGTEGFSIYANKGGKG